MAGSLPPPSDSSADTPSALAAAFVAALVRDGLAGPVFVVATDDVVGTLAPVWAEAFARLGWHHRVRGITVGANDRELLDVATEILGFAAGVIVVAAPAEIVAAVRRMPGGGLPPVVAWPTLPRPSVGNVEPAD